MTPAVPDRVFAREYQCEWIGVDRVEETPPSPMTMADLEAAMEKLLADPDTHRPRERGPCVVSPNEYGMLKRAGVC